MNYYRRYPGDYLAATSRLSMTEHGAYTLMLDYYYAEEAPLPADKDELYTMLRAMRPEDRAAVDKVLDRYWILEADGYHNKRADEEIAVSKQARLNGANGGRPKEEKTGKRTGKRTGNGTDRETDNDKSGFESGYEKPPFSETGSGHPPTTNHSREITTADPSTDTAELLPRITPADAAVMGDAQAVLDAAVETLKARDKLSHHTAQTYLASRCKVHGTSAVVAALREMSTMPVATPRAWLDARLENANGNRRAGGAQSAVDRVRAAAAEREAAAAAAGEAY